ncbi:cysteine/serine-rich nuclear protein 1-like [Betta splendens]|uniref:Cysteine/serine-rich nuclear protein 1-like n=1 Tax=Betta splendens TaxID=158456 RepID=A0A6P7L1L4_BETSP|nr:cysteine/serine-rich nuclear protein 1-like [Betta splendens]
MRVLKRKFAEVEDDRSYCSSSSPSSLSSLACSEWESDGESSCPDNKDFTPYSPSSPALLPSRSILKRPKLRGAQSNVHFDQVTVFSFPRCQGFASVPRRGGATLGMVQRHSDIQKYSVAEHALELHHRRRVRLQKQLGEEQFKAMTPNLTITGTSGQPDRLTVDEDSDILLSNGDVENSILQPYSSKQRQALLQAAGVKRIDREEKKQLHSLRLSREACGCDCQGFCEPEICACSLAGIKCQMDRFSFPCGCTKDGCGNIQGRVEFDSRRVQTHHIHTLMKLELEEKVQDETLSLGGDTGLPEDLVEFENQNQTHEAQIAEGKSCPFGFTLEEDCASLSMPVSPSFPFTPEQMVVEEENSCSSDMTDSSCSLSDSDTGFCTQNPLEVGTVLLCCRSICNSEYNNYSTCNQARHIGDPATCSTTESMGPLTANTFTENISRISLTNCLDENANQDRDCFDHDSLEDFPTTLSPTVDYSIGTYMDLSLSSDSDLEFFDSDYPTGPLHSSFKGHSHPDRFRHIQLFSSVNLPQYESSTYLLESLIGLT